MTEKKTKSFDFQLIVRIFKLAMPYKSIFYISLVLTLFLTILAPIRPWLVQYAIDTSISNKDIQGLMVICGYIILHIIINSVFVFLNSYMTSLLGQNVIEDLRKSIYAHLLTFQKRFMDKTKVGNLVTRSVSDIETISDFFSSGIITVIGEIAQLFTIIGFMFYMSWQLTLVSLSVLPVMLLSSEIFRRGVKTSFQAVRTQVSLLNSFVQERITGMEVVQVFGQREREYTKFQAINKDHLEAHKKSIFYYSVYFPVVEILNSVAIGLIIWWAAGSGGSVVSAGLVISFVLYIGLLFRPLRVIADRFNSMQMGMVASERVFALLDNEEEVENEGNLDKKIYGSVRFENVWFAYNEEDFVLKNISFAVEKGRSLAIVGPTGAGKSSIIGLISKLYEINKGSIFIDDTPISDFKLTRLRQQVAVVLQDVFLFSGTLFENIQMKNPLITLEKATEAASQMGLTSFIESLPGQWDYQVSERGNSLSVGQRQLVSFIRAVASDPSIIILDEATSSIDSENEQLIQETIKKLMRNRTSIVIAHRLSTIQAADEILVLKRGEVVERGNHQRLLENQGLYFEMHQKQEVEMV